MWTLPAQLARAVVAQRGRMKAVVRAWRRRSVSGDAVRCGAIIICEEWNDEAPDWMLLGVSGGFWKHDPAFLDG